MSNLQGKFVRNPLLAQVTFSRAMRWINSRKLLGSVGRPSLLDFHRQKVLNAVRCHLMNVSGLTITSASRQSKSMDRAIIARRIEAVVRRGFVRRSWNRASCFSEEQILSDQGDA
jgi:hypothetical protein